LVKIEYKKIKIFLINKESMSCKMKYSVEELTRKLCSLEIEIECWGCKYSQSNPGAVMELRSMRKQYSAIQNLLKVELLKQKEKETLKEKSEE
jgi:hypothetical protein